MEVVVKRANKFAKLYDLPIDTSIVVLMGGRGGGKTYEASKFIAYSSTILGKRCQVLRDEAVNIKESIMNEVLLRFDTANRDGVFDKSFSRLGNGIKNTKTGEMVVFSKGFRASSLEKKANMKSVSNIDIAVIEEAEDLRDEDKFNTFSDSIRKEGSVIIIILNTPDIHHWIVKRFFDAIPLSVDDEPDLLGEDLDGYFKLVPKGVSGVVCMQSNYVDNEFLPHKTKIQYEAYGDPTSSMYNLHHYLTNIKGYSTTGLKGQIFKNYDMISLEEYNLIDSLEVFGVDFGTASPAGVVAVKIIGNDLYVRELNYEPCDLISLGKKLNDLGIGSHDLIVADCAEPTTILELRMGLEKYFSAEDRERYPAASYGFGNIRPSPDKSINSGISKMLGMRIHVVKGSDNLVKEFTMYVWATDRDGKSLDKPVDNWNHCFVGDTMISTKRGQKRIKEIIVGDMVLTRNGLRKVLNVWDNGIKEVFMFTINGRLLECTKDHKVYTSNRGFTPINELVLGDTIVLEGGETLITSLDMMPFSNPEKVYDLEVETDHEYYANGVLVHNCIDPIRYITRVHGIWF